MTREELNALTIWIEAMIDLRIEAVFGRDYTIEYLREKEIRRDLYAAMGVDHD